MLFIYFCLVFLTCSASYITFGLDLLQTGPTASGPQSCRNEGAEFINLCHAPLPISTDDKLMIFFLFFPRN